MFFSIVWRSIEGSYYNHPTMRQSPYLMPIWPGCRFGYPPMRMPPYGMLSMPRKTITETAERKTMHQQPRRRTTDEPMMTTSMPTAGKEEWVPRYNAPAQLV